MEKGKVAFLGFGRNVFSLVFQKFISEIESIENSTDVLSDDEIIEKLQEVFELFLNDSSAVFEDMKKSLAETNDNRKCLSILIIPDEKNSMAGFREAITSYLREIRAQVLIENDKKLSAVLLPDLSGSFPFKSLNIDLLDFESFFKELEFFESKALLRKNYPLVGTRKASIRNKKINMNSALRRQNTFPTVVRVNRTFWKR